MYTGINEVLYKTLLLIHKYGKMNSISLNETTVWQLETLSVSEAIIQLTSYPIFMRIG